MANFMKINDITCLTDLGDLNIVDQLSLAIQLKSVIVIVNEIAQNL